MQKVTYGIIGTGAIAAIHAEAMRYIENAELKLVYDRVPEKAASFAAAHGCGCARSLEEFLASDVEAVTVATPSGLHGEVAIPAARAGKHIFCEKPLEVTPEKTTALIDACRESGVLLSAVFQSRYSRAVQAIKKAVDAGRFGDMVLASASVRWYRAPDYYRNAGWRGTWALDGGGALMNQGIHTADLLLYFNGDVEEVCGFSGNVLHKTIEVEDTLAGVLKFRNGSFGTIEASTACKPGFARRIELSGTRGSITLEDDRIIRWCFDEERPGDHDSGLETGEGLHGGSGDPRAITVEGHRRQLQELTDAIQGACRLSIPGEDGRRVVEMICNLYRNKPVTVQRESVRC